MKDITSQYLPYRESQSDNPPKERFNLSVPEEGYVIGTAPKLSFLDKRMNHLRDLMVKCRYDISYHPIMNSIAQVCARMVGVKNNRYMNSTPEFKLYTFKGLEELPNGEHFNGLNFNPSWDTRDILLDEIILELEKGTPEQNARATFETILNLQKLQIEFYVFYAEGMRTPHIHIYGMLPEVCDWVEKELACLIFARKVVPMEYFHLLDTALFSQHTISLEFSKHYKHGTMLRCIWSYSPKEEKCN